MTRYAQGTTVPPERSRAEIEKTLSRYGADAFGYLVDTDRAVIEFRADGRRVRFVVNRPDADDQDFLLDKRGYLLTTTQTLARVEAEERRRWRALALAIKAKLEVVASGIASFEEEFLPHIVLPNGETVGQWIVPQVAAAYESKQMPTGITLALPAAKGKEGD